MTIPGGRFTSENWNCLTANALRDHAERRETWSEGQYLGVIPFDGAFIVLSWYKHRGRTEGAWMVFEGEALPLTLEHAEECLMWVATETPRG